MRKSFLAILPILFIMGCSSNDEIIKEEQPPIQLSEAEEINVWIYNQMCHYYLWNDDIPDSADCDFQLTPRQFYESLFSPKDRFSYMSFRSTRSAQNGCSYGFAYQKLSDRMGREYLSVLYVTSESARSAGLHRGDIVAVATADSGHITLRKYRHTNGGGLEFEREVSFPTASTRAGKNETVYIDSIYNVGRNHKVGYLCYLEYDNPTDFRESFNRFHQAGISDLVLDLRYNPGGLVNTCRKLCNLIVSSNAYGQLFQQSSYNAIVAQENLQRYGDERTYTYYDTPAADAPSGSAPVLGGTYDYLNLKRVYVLVSSHTASASEATINSLKPYMDVVVIGENTVGKGVGMQTISTSKYPYALVPITFRFYNAVGETIPEDGLVPDYYLPEGYNTRKIELGDTDEPLLHQALSLIRYGKVVPVDTAFVREVDTDLLSPVGDPSFVTEFNNKYYSYEK